MKKKKLNVYKVQWRQVNYGVSYVKASSKKEAKQLAQEGKDYDFEDFMDTYGTNPDWSIVDLELYDNDID